MVIIVPIEISPGIAILIMLPYFAVVIATIVYTHKKLEKSKNKSSDDDNNKDIVSEDNNND